MTESDYDKKMNTLLEDKKTYKIIKTDPTKKYQKQNNELIDRWDKKLYIPPSVAKNLKIHNAITPKIYGLPKIHKNDVPLRPIVSCIQSPFNLLSKFLKNILNNIVYKNNYYIRDSIDLKEKIKDITIPQNYILVSLDVISLYTSIPIKLVTKVIEEKWDEIKQYTDIPMNEFIEATELTLNSTYFMYKDQIYKQIEGCAMGASISSVAAQMVMEHLESKVLSDIDFEIPFFYRYVDDCLTAIPKEKIRYIEEKFNAYNKHIQFTSEIENDKKINFLDITLHHTNQTIKTEWYTKKTWSSRYLNFLSNHPANQKRSVIIGLADRSIRLSDPEYRDAAIKKAKNALKENNHPQKLINKIFKDRLQEFLNTKNNQNQIENKNIKKDTRYIALPFVNGLSQQLQGLHKKYNITICHKAHNLLANNFSKLKSVTPLNKRSNVIYEIPCSNCAQVYIGQTSQWLENRLKGHKYDKKNVTALTNHVSTENHTFDFNKTKILKTENHQKKREFYEMVEIQKNKNAVNDKKDLKNLSKIYLSIL